MPLITCEDCQAQVSDRAISCPRCGAPLQAGGAQEPPRGRAADAVGSRATLLVLGAIFVSAGTIALTTALIMDVSAPGSTVVNLDLLNWRQNLVVIAAALGGLGVISLIAVHTLLAADHPPDPFTLQQLGAAQLGLAVITVGVVLLPSAFRDSRLPSFDLSKDFSTPKYEPPPTPETRSYVPAYNPPVPKPTPRLLECECFAWDHKEALNVASGAATERNLQNLERILAVLEISARKCSGAISASYGRSACDSMLEDFTNEVEVLKVLGQNRMRRARQPVGDANEKRIEACLGRGLTSRPPLCGPGSGFVRPLASSDQDPSEAAAAQAERISRMRKADEERLAAERAERERRQREEADRQAAMRAAAEVQARREQEERERVATLRRASGWDKIRKGLSRDDVRQILGEPKWTEKQITGEYWMYVERVAMGAGTVMFLDGRVSTWREP